ncbi:aldo/keto reductase [Frigoribacterium sp. R86507]|uniref:aldo/keto reductase n=1 Tax=Frigoribacterium sp. R86507 TaxID=3093850 RepID=UPI0037CCA6ED
MPLIGTSDLDVFPLALGGNTFGWTSDEAESHSVLDAFVAGGGNFVDTADVYSAWADGNSGGESETVIGTWLAQGGASRRDQVVLGTKVSQHPEFPGLGAANVVAAADASLTRLQTDHIDLYWAHFDTGDDLAETLGAFDALQKAGKVRHVGISNFSPERITEWVEIARSEGFAAPVALQPHYNLVTRKAYERDLAPLAALNQLGVTPYFSLAAGFLTGKYQTRDDIAGARSGNIEGYFSDEGLDVVAALSDIASAHQVEIATIALAWLQAQPRVVAPIASARTLEQLPALLASASVALSADELAALETVSARVAE